MYFVDFNSFCKPYQSVLQTVSFPNPVSQFCKQYPLQTLSVSSAKHPRIAKNNEDTNDFHVRSKRKHKNLLQSPRIAFLAKTPAQASERQNSRDNYNSQCQTNSFVRKCVSSAKSIVSCTNPISQFCKNTHV